MPAVQNQGGIQDIVQLFQSLGPLLGSGKTSTGSKTTTSADPATLGQSDDLIKQIMDSVNPDNLDAQTSNILERAKQTFAPNNISPNASGIRGYSDTVNSSLRNEAMARATAEAMSARLTATNAAAKTSAGLVESKLQATKTVQQQQTQQTGPNTAGKVLSAATPLALLYNQFRNKAPKVPDKVEDPEDTTDPVVSADSSNNIDYVNNDINVNDASGGGFPVQDSGSSDLILNSSQSDVPLPLDFSSEQPLVDSTPTDIPAEDAPSDTIDASEPAFDAIDTSSDTTSEAPGIFDDIFGGDFSFADGGVVPAGRRPAPNSYEDDALPGNNRAPIASIFSGGAIADSSLARTPTPAAISRKQQLQGSPAGDLNSTSGDGKDAGEFSSIDDGTPAPAGLGLGIGLANHAFSLSMGPLGLAFSLGLALAKNATISKDGPDAPAPPGMDNFGPLQEPAPNQAPPDPPNFDLDGMSPPDPGLGPDPNAPDPTPDQDPGNDDNGDDSDGGGGGSGGDGGDGGDGGGGDADGGVLIADNAQESNGIDKKKINVTPGEAVLPVDTVHYLQSKYGESIIDDLIRHTHTPIRYGVR